MLLHETPDDFLSEQLDKLLVNGLAGQELSIQAINGGPGTIVSILVPESASMLLLSVVALAVPRRRRRAV